MIDTTPTESNLSGLDKKAFQKNINNQQTDLYILKNAQGMEVAVTNYGCALLSIMVPDKNGKYANVVLGHDSIEHVINSPEPFLSTTIGRYGNRIANGKFTLYGEEHQLPEFPHRGNHSAPVGVGGLPESILSGDDTGNQPVLQPEAVHQYRDYGTE